MEINILFVGDIVGKPGIEFVQTWLPSLEKKYKADIIVANGENACDGKGLTEKEAQEAKKGLVRGGIIPAIIGLVVLIIIAIVIVFLVRKKKG